MEIHVSMICSFQMGGGGGITNQGVKGEMNGKIKHKGVVADEQTKLHKVKVEIMWCSQFSAKCAYKHLSVRNAWI